MKSWLSAAEIAALKLPGLPSVERAVRRYAQRHGWENRARAGRGGGLEYAVAALPPDARAAYVAHEVETVSVPAAVARAAAAEPGAERITARAAAARDARLALLALVDRFAAEARLLSQKRADRHFCDRYNRGEVAVAPWIKAEVKSLAPRTLQRWRDHVRAGRRSQLAVDRGQPRKGTGVLDRANNGEVKTYILALIAKQPQLTAHHIRAMVADRFATLDVAGRAIAVPPVRTLQHALKAWRTDYRVELEALRNPDAFKSAMRFAARVSQPAQRLNEVWQIDASPADMLCIDGRHSIYACVDVYSRRLIALVTKTPRASAVGLLMRKAILAWGVPERVKTDNGSDFVARDTQRLLAALAIEHETAAPFSPEQKGHVERAIGTLQRGLMRTLPGFVGHSVADRKVIEGRKSFAQRLGEAADDTFQVGLTAAELQDHVDGWCADVYGNAPHAGLRGQTPFAVAAMATATVHRIHDERALDMLLAPVAGKDGLRTVTKSGIRIDGSYYIAGFLDVGESVMVRMDAHDMGRVYVFDESGVNFLGVAVAPELAGIDPAHAIAAARAEQKRLIDTRMADAKAEARKIKGKDFAPAIRRQALKDAGKLVEFPKREDVHATPALAAASRAFARDDSVARHDPSIAALAEALRAESENATPALATVTRLPVHETAHHRWTRARRIEAMIAAGDHVEAGERDWLASYSQGPEYRGFALTYGDQPEAAAQA